MIFLYNIIIYCIIIFILITNFKLHVHIFIYHITFFIHVPPMMFANCVYVIIYVLYWAYCLYFQNKLYYFYTITSNNGCIILQAVNTTEPAVL